jgi:hypothetical protein
VWLWVQFFTQESVTRFDGALVTGEFKTNNKEFDQFIIVENGIIKSINYHIAYKINNGDQKKIVITQNEAYALRKGDKVIQFKDLSLEPHKRIELIHPLGEYYTIILGDSGIILKVINESLINLFRTLGIIVLIATVIALLVVFN